MRLQAPVPDSFKRPQNHPSLNPSANLPNRRASGIEDVDATFLTTDTSFVDNPPSSKAASKFKNAASPAPTPKKPAAGAGRGRGIPTARGRGGIPTRGGATRGARGSGIARGTTRGRGRGV
jgi:DASH complex subunit DAM1